MIDCFIHDNEVYHTGEWNINIFKMYVCGILGKSFKICKIHKSISHFDNVRGFITSECEFYYYDELKETNPEYFI